MAHKKPDPSDKQIGQPLGPKVVESVGILEGLPREAGDFEPTGKWTHDYRLWGSHGYYRFQNKNMGMLRIARNPGDGDGSVELTVHKELVNGDGIIQRLDARMTCRDDELSTPMFWEMTSAFTDADGTDVPQLTTRFSGRVEKETLRQTLNGQETEQPLAGPYTCDWCLFDVVQRLSEGRGRGAFILLEGLTIMKPNHRLRMMTDERQGIDAVSGPLRCVVQVGTGLVPYEYWLDEKQRLVLAFTGTMAIILDDQAEAKTEQLANDLRRGGVYYEY